MLEFIEKKNVPSPAHELVSLLNFRTSATYTSPTATQSVMMIQDLNGITQQVNSYQPNSRANVSIGQRYPPPLIPVRNVNGSQNQQQQQQQQQRYHPYSNNAVDAVDLSNLSRYIFPGVGYIYTEICYMATT